MKQFRPGWVYSPADQAPETSDTIGGLAKKLGLDPHALEKTINDFNKACSDKQFDLMKLDGRSTLNLSPNKTNWANPITKPPYYGYPMTCVVWTN